MLETNPKISNLNPSLRANPRKKEDILNDLYHPQENRGHPDLCSNLPHFKSRIGKTKDGFPRGIVVIFLLELFILASALSKVCNLEN